MVREQEYEPLGNLYNYIRFSSLRNYHISQKDYVFYYIFL